MDYGFGAVVYTVSISHGIAFSLIYAQTIGCILKWFLSGNQGKSLILIEKCQFGYRLYAFP